MKLQVKELDFLYDCISGNKVLDNFSFEAESGSYWCVAGPNGVGKSTLLKLIAGLLPCFGDYKQKIFKSIYWDSKPLEAYSRIDLAKNIAFVSSDFRTEFSVSVLDFVLQSRFPHASVFQRFTKNDFELAIKALEQVEFFRDNNKDALTRDLRSLSGGEFQLVQLARAIAQESKVLIIDEGLSNLDLRFQKIIFAMIDRLHFSGKTIFLVCHDLNLISEFCPNILWMASGKNFIAGPTFQVFSQENLEQVYGLNNAFTVGENPHTKRLKYFWK